jgi:hypothetical protein
MATGCQQPWPFVFMELNSKNINVGTAALGCPRSAAPHLHLYLYIFFRKAGSWQRSLRGA